jgi:hypothetical protein
MNPLTYYAGDDSWANRPDISVPLGDYGWQITTDGGTNGSCWKAWARCCKIQ